MTIEKNTKPNIIDSALNGLRDIFAPNLIALMAAGILQGILIILQTTGIVPADQAEDFILSNISNAIFYFLPVLLAYSSAEVFKTNKVLAASVALFLLHPDVVATMGDPIPGADFFGIPLVNTGTYNNSVIPIILIIWAQSYIEKACKEFIPEIVRGILLPVIVLALTAILGVLIIGPIGNLLGDLLGSTIAAINNFSGWIVPVILGAFGLFIVMAGGHYTLFPLSTQMLSTVGYDNIMSPGLLASNMALAGAALAVMIKTNNKDYRSYSLSATITAALGVSQPALYGIALPIRSVLIAAIVGGGLGGLYAGISNFVFYAFVNPGIAAIPAFLAPDGSMGNFINGLVVMLIAFFTAFAIVMIMPYQDLPEKEIKELTAEDE
jgi:PTS system beta-glucosides-specific IIC component